MVKRKAKRFLAGLCVASMLMQSIGESTMTAMAAEYVTADEISSETDISDGDAQTTVSEGDSEPTVTDGNAEDILAGDEPSPDGDGQALAYESDRVVIDDEGNVTVDGEILFGNIDDEGNLIIYANIGNIPTDLFKGWTDVKSISFEEDAYIKSIADNTFKDCENLETIDFSNCKSLTQIGGYAFSGCTSLKTVNFNDNLQYISRYAFEKCTSLESVRLVPGLISIREYAFSGCTSLNKVRVETANVVCKTTSGGAATGIFNNCNIKTIEFAIQDSTEDSNQNSIIVPANLFNKAKFADDADIVIPYKIQEIGEGAFSGSNLKAITFENGDQTPSALSTIGKNAFKDCKDLANVTFISTLQTIEEGAFQNCTLFTDIVIPDSVNNLGKYAFQGCKNVTNLQLPNATTTIGDYAFRDITSLETVIVPEGVTFTGKGEFYGCTKLSTVTLPSTLEILGDETFRGCTSIVTMDIPERTTSIGKNAFENCSYLKTVTYSPNITVINDAAFRNCINFTSNVFPEVLEKIGANAFENCQSFRNTTIPANVSAIGNRAFYGCYGIDVLTIDSTNLTTCGTQIFDECLIRRIVFPEGITTIPANLFSQASFTTDFVMTIPNTVTVIGANAFGGTQANEVNISSFKFEKGTKLTTIGASAFKYCTAITEFTIPETTEEIGANAFEGCGKISSIVIPESVTKIGTSAFSNCSVLSDVTYNAINVTTSNQNIFAKCNIKRIIIGEKVSTFPAYLFKGAQFSTNSETGEVELISIKVPASVEKIGQYALPNIANLQKVVFEDDSKLTTIEQYAFSQCINLTSCNIPDSVTTIGNYAFSGCTKLGSDDTAPFKLPDSLLTLGSYAFSACPSLEEVTVPMGVAKIGDRAFMNDTGLTAVTLTGGALKEIGISAFEGCSGIEEVEIPTGVTRINAATFKNCSGLTKVVLPASLTFIASDAFTGCETAQFYAVPGSYAEKWLQDNGFNINNLLTITYVLNGGVNSPKNPAGFESGDNFSFEPATRVGYNFKGWYLEENFETEITGVEGCTNDIKVYAKWEIEEYTITYVLNGGENHKDNPETYTILDNVTLKNATREGYTFEGWLTDPENERSMVTMIAAGSYGNKILYAKWSGGVTNAPTASIESGSVVKSGTKLFLSSSTPGASIYYTMDGTEPTVESKQYVDGIIIDKAVTVKAMAVKKGCDESETAVFVYDIIDETVDWGDIIPEDQARFSNAAEVPKGIWVAGVEDTVYTGQKIAFDLRVYDYKTLLTEKTDYTVKYSYNTDAADKNAGKKAPCVTITAKGNYKGKAVVYFTIHKRDIASEDITAEDIITNVTGKVQKPVPVLYYGKKKLANKKDYTFEYLGATSGGYQNKGIYEIKLTGQGNYTGVRTMKFTLVEATSLSKAKITGLSTRPYDNGKEITQDFTVKVGSVTLTKGTDYDVVYSNNINAGTATVTIVGKDKYYGSKSATFKITPITTLNKVQFTLDKASVTYTGEAYEIGRGINVTAAYNGTPLVKDKDYTCTYAKNTDVGTATITFTGKGGYAGTAKKTFKIVGADISALKLSFLDNEGNVKSDSEYKYEKGGVKPQVQLMYGGNTLVSGKDYTITYKKNTALGTADVIIKGKKNYTGTLSGNFTIVKRDVTELSVTATDVMYKDKAGAISTCKTTVLDVNGKTLTSGKDYKVSYVYVNNTRLMNGTLKKAGTAVNPQSDVIPVETLITVKVTGQGEYTGTAETTIRFYKNSIASAKVTVKPQIYTGSEVQPGIDQMKVMIGKEELKVGDFEIVSYKNNIKKGTAQVTIRGIGNYGGTKTVSFKIVEKSFSLFDWLF